MIDELPGASLLAEADIERFCRYGHFAYESGDHGDVWLALGLLSADPRRLRAAAGRLAEKLRPYAPEVVCGPLVGGALVGQWVAYELDTTFVYAEPRGEAGKGGRRYRVPRELRPALGGRRAVVVDDAINAGAATLSSVREIEGEGGVVVAVAALLARAPGGPDDWANLRFGVEYLVGLPWNGWPAADCPLCRAGVPIERLP